MRQRHWLLRLMALHVVVNSTQLYELKETEPLAIPFQDESINLMVTNGFHASEPLQLSFEDNSTYFFQVKAIINNIGIATLIIASLLFFVLYALNGGLPLLILANLPILALISLFFLQPRRAIVLKAWQPEVS